MCFQEACVHIRVQSWAGGKDGFDPLLSPVLHGGSQIHCHQYSRAGDSEKQLASIGEYATDGTVALAVLHQSLFPLCYRKSQVHFSSLPSLLLWDFTPFSVISSIHAQARCCSMRVPPCEHRLLGSPASTPLLVLTPHRLLAVALCRENLAFA